MPVNHVTKGSKHVVFVLFDYMCHFLKSGCLWLLPNGTQIALATLRRNKFNTYQVFCQNPCVYVCRRGTAALQTLRISRSLAMAEFSVKSFALFMWWRVYEACSQICSLKAYGQGVLIAWSLQQNWTEQILMIQCTNFHFCKLMWWCTMSGTVFIVWR